MRHTALLLIAASCLMAALPALAAPDITGDWLIRGTCGDKDLTTGTMRVAAETNGGLAIEIVEPDSRGQPKSRIYAGSFDAERGLLSATGPRPIPPYGNKSTLLMVLDADETTLTGLYVHESLFKCGFTLAGRGDLDPLAAALTPIPRQLSREQRKALQAKHKQADEAARAFVQGEIGEFCAALAAWIGADPAEKAPVRREEEIRRGMLLFDDARFVPAHGQPIDALSDADRLKVQYAFERACREPTSPSWLRKYAEVGVEPKGQPRAVAAAVGLRNLRAWGNRVTTGTIPADATTLAASEALLAGFLPDAHAGIVEREQKARAAAARMLVAEALAGPAGKATVVALGSLRGGALLEPLPEAEQTTLLAEIEARIATELETIAAAETQGLPSPAATIEELTAQTGWRYRVVLDYGSLLQEPSLVALMARFDDIRTESLAAVQEEAFAAIIAADSLAEIEALRGRLGISPKDRAHDAGSRILDRLAAREGAMLDATARAQLEADLAVPPTADNVLAALRTTLVSLGGEAVGSRTVRLPGIWLSTTEQTPSLQQMTFGDVTVTECRRLPASYLCAYTFDATIDFVPEFLNFVGTWRAQALNLNSRILDGMRAGENEFVRSGGAWFSPTAHREMEAALTGGASLLR